MELFEEYLDSFFWQIMGSWGHGFDKESVTYAEITYETQNLQEITERYKVNVFSDRNDIEKRVKDCCESICKNEGINLSSIKDILFSYTGPTTPA